MWLQWTSNLNVERLQSVALRCLDSSGADFSESVGRPTVTRANPFLGSKISVNLPAVKVDVLEFLRFPVGILGIPRKDFN